MGASLGAILAYLLYFNDYERKYRQQNLAFTLLQEIY